MVSIAICDDDRGFREALLHILKASLPSAFSVSQYADGMELLHGLEQRQRRMDLVLLDIRMPRLDGLQTARRVRELDRGAVIILITGYGEYVYQGYDVQAFHFLTKPLDEGQFLPVLSRAVAQAEERRADYLAVDKQSECLYIPLREILFIESGSRKLLVHTDAGQVEYYEKLSVLEGGLAPRGFCRIHRCCLVNLDAVRYVDKKGLWVHLRDGNRLEVSRRRLNHLLLALMGSL